jgi:dsDNA-binding SOS-regulon protein
MSLTALYQTSDGKTHTSRRDANKHQATLDTIRALTDLVQANVEDLSDTHATAVAEFLVTAAAPLMAALRQLKPQPLQDVTVLSELGLVSPAIREAAESEATPDVVLDEPVAEVAPVAEVEPVVEQGTAVDEAPDDTTAAEPEGEVNFTAPPPPVAQPEAEATERAPGSFF